MLLAISFDENPDWLDGKQTCIFQVSGFRQQHDHCAWILENPEIIALIDREIVTAELQIIQSSGESLVQAVIATPDDLLMEIELAIESFKVVKDFPDPATTVRLATELALAKIMDEQP